LYTFVQFPERIPGWRVVASALGYHGEIVVIEKEYFVRQAAILLGLAKATTDPKISAAILDKAAELKSQVDEPITDSSPRAPDLQPEK
jgi:hypothetical protein